ncbi:class I SAM-dependent methyltransferase [Malaciobacter canalis]|uniref:class I SAM-dependent methyltransferase n=1 Tax=Malaciobacter canalis TaxID=1912871 RepID=UPI00384FC1B3
MSQENNYRVKYQTIEIGTLDIHLKTLKDKQQFFDKDDIAQKLGISSAQWPIFGILWEAGEVLANLMLTYEIEGKRILELGCGLALASMVLNLRGANITATDYHPEVASFLKYNSLLNSKKNIPYFQASWDDKVSIVEKFDVIIGSDVLYERTHVNLLSSFIELYANKKCEIIIIDPARGNHNAFCRKMDTFGFSSRNEKPITDYLPKAFKGKVLYLNR